MDIDQSIRLAAFKWLSEQVEIYGDVLPRSLLEKGFLFKNERIHLISAQGIFKPKNLELPLTITTSPKSPYEDSFSADGFLLYKYRGTDADHRDNMGLRKALVKGLPLIYFHGITPGKYLAVWPVYIIDDDPNSLTFKIAVDDIHMVSKDFEQASSVAEDDSGRRAYITATVKARLHQRGFREKVLHAYKTQCALCRLKHDELLDAAHIIPDNEPDSVPTVNNGIALCKLHHAAFDSFILGISPDYIINVRQDVLHESDGPMLQHGLKELHSRRIILPSSKPLWPKQEYLDRRYQKFKNAL
jgi:putative restriction endonuclease